MTEQDMSSPTPPEGATALAERERQMARALQACIPWIASSGRGMAQEALALACDLVGYDPFDWSSHPDVLKRRLETMGWGDRIEVDYRLRLRAESPPDSERTQEGGP